MTSTYNSCNAKSKYTPTSSQQSYLSKLDVFLCILFVYFERIFFFKFTKQCKWLKVLFHLMSFVLNAKDLQNNVSASQYNFT